MGCEDTISGPMIVPFFLRLDRTRKRAKSPSELGQDILDGAEVASVLPVSPQSRWGAPAWMMWPKPMGRLEILIIWCLFCSTSLKPPLLLPGDLTNTPAALLTPCEFETLLLIWLPLRCHHLLLLLPFLVLFHSVHCTNLLICSVSDISSCSLVLLIHREKTWWKPLAVEITKLGLSGCVLGRK